LKKFIFILVPVVSIFFNINFSFAAKEMEVYGTLIDTKCYGMNHSNLEDDHMTIRGKMKSCTKMCAKSGIPVGLLVDGKIDGKVYTLAVPAPALADYMGKAVRVTGIMSIPNNIVPKKIELLKGDKFEEISLVPEETKMPKDDKSEKITEEIKTEKTGKIIEEITEEITTEKL